MRYFTSPLTGGAITVPQFQQLFLLAKQNGQRMPEDWANWVWQVLFTQGMRLIKGGERLETPEANVAELTAQAQEFERKALPVLKALQIV